MTYYNDLSLCTAIQVLYGPKALGLRQPGDEGPSNGTWLFIYGGSTSVGQYAIQLAKLSGYKVATVASSHNHELIKNLGADVVFDVSISIASPISEFTDRTLPLFHSTRTPTQLRN